MAVSEEIVAKADEAMNANNFVTEKEVPEMASLETAREIASALTKAREGNAEAGYIYVEPFDFQGGEIKNIIWNMDKIESRDDAKQALAAHLNLTIMKDTLSAADKVTF
ncbi:MULTISPECIES: hypothetical protein [Lacticaseibacillus]|uniref:Uncharacterized protein n=2 Tax=Lacticaseibacillus TaxID=2759736 RepID=A0ABW4CLW8_9LACO|nr:MULTISPECIES: hypothetical protein [Lacticaseibacillus]